MRHGLFVSSSLHRPLLVCQKAERLRKETGDSRYWAPAERKHMPFGQLVKLVLGRPFLVLAEEPMLIAITLYMSVSTISPDSSITN